MVLNRFSISYEVFIAFKCINLVNSINIYAKVLECNKSEFHENGFGFVSNGSTRSLRFKHIFESFSN